MKSYRTKRRKTIFNSLNFSNSLCCVKKPSKHVKLESFTSGNDFEIIPLDSSDPRLRTYSEETTVTNISVLPLMVEDNIGYCMEKNRVIKANNFKRSHSAAVNFSRDFDLKTNLTVSQASFDGDGSIYNYSEGSLKSILAEMDYMNSSNYGSTYLKRIKENPIDSEEESSLSLLINNKPARRTTSCREAPKIFVEEDEILYQTIPADLPSHSPKNHFSSSNIDRQLSAPNMRLRLSHYPEYQNYNFTNYLGIFVRLNNRIKRISNT